MTNMVRTDVADRLVDVFTAAIAAPVKVLDHIPTDAPGDFIPQEWVGIGNMQGTLEITSFRGGSTASYQDTFEITVVVQAATNGKAAMAARVRCGVIVQAVIDAIRADPGLTTPSGISGFASMELGDVDGPNVYPNGSQTGYFSVAEITLRCLTAKLGA